MKFSSTILFLFLTVTGFPQNNLVFEHYSVQNGLPNPTVYDVLQDKYGFLWIATGDGLCRYDGYEFKVYKNNPNDSTSLPSNTVLSIIEDDDGNLWIGGIGLFAKYVRKTGTFVPLQFDRGSRTGTIQIWKLFEDSKNRVWFGSRNHGVYLFNHNKNSGLTFNSNINNIQIDATGRVYVATLHGVDLLIPGTDIQRMVPSLMTRQYKTESLSSIRS